MATKKSKKSNERKILKSMFAEPLPEPDLAARGVDPEPLNYGRGVMMTRPDKEKENSGRAIDLNSILSEYLKSAHATKTLTITVTHDVVSNTFQVSTNRKQPRMNGGMAHLGSISGDEHDPRLSVLDGVTSFMQTRRTEHEIIRSMLRETEEPSSEMKAQ
jgi:hypothetical protein